MTEKLPRKIEKPWGFELLFAQTPQYAGKLIFVKKEHSLSLQYHEIKDETMYLFQGEALLEIEVGGKMTSKTFKPGQSVRVPPHTKHRLKAIEDTMLFEVSTPELDDVVRLEDDYGRANK
jgi:mannose-6-phosphate isomerase